MRSDDKEAASSGGGGGLLDSKFWIYLSLEAKSHSASCLCTLPTSHHFFLNTPRKKKKLPLHTLQVKPKVKRYGTIHTYCFVSGFSNTGLGPKLSPVIFPFPPPGLSKRTSILLHMHIIVLRRFEDGMGRFVPL